jgi:hypothetical protein
MIPQIVVYSDFTQIVSAPVVSLLLALWSGVRLTWVHLVRRTLIGLLYQPQMMCVKQSVEWELGGETEVLGENLPQWHFVHHKTPHDLAWARTWASAVGSQRLTAWAMARPSAYVTLIFFLSPANVSCSRPDARGVCSWDDVPLIMYSKVENVFIKNLYSHLSRYLWPTYPLSRIDIMMYRLRAPDITQNNEFARSYMFVFILYVSDSIKFNSYWLVRWRNSAFIFRKISKGK